jgi:hypothetical protein
MASALMSSNDSGHCQLIRIGQLFHIPSIAYVRFSGLGCGAVVTVRRVSDTWVTFNGTASPDAAVA